MRATFLGQGPGVEGLRSRLDPFVVRLGRHLAMRECTLSIMLTDDAGIRGYNEKFVGRSESTDVLSFPSEVGDADDSGHYLGDMVISLERAAAQAREHGHSLAEEVEVLVLHGVLHLMGHDHETDGGQMREVEARLARELFGSVRGLVERGDVEGDDSEGRRGGDGDRNPGGSR